MDTEKLSDVESLKERLREIRCCLEKWKSRFDLNNAEKFEWFQDFCVTSKELETTSWD